MSWLLVSDRLTSAVAQALTTNTLFALHVDAAAVLLAVLLAKILSKETKCVGVAAHVGKELEAKALGNGFCFLKFHN